MAHHSVRKTFSVEYCKACRDLGLPSVGAQLGHSDLKTTLNIYTQAIPESQKRAVEKVAGLVFRSFLWIEKTENRTN